LDFAFSPWCILSIQISRDKMMEMKEPFLDWQPERLALVQPQPPDKLFFSHGTMST